MRKVLLIFVWMLPWLLAAQPLLPTDVWEQVRTHHPMARQADLLAQQGQQMLLLARAGFDPKLYADHQQKLFGGKDYYSYGQGGVKVDTRWGVALKAGYDWTDNNGLFLNPERKITEGGQAFIGLEVPLLQGLLIDENRAALRQAQIGQGLQASLADALRNELYIRTLKAYWDWSFAYHARELAVEARTYSWERLDGVRQSFLAGDNPAIDTLEAYLQWQSWEMEVQNATLQRTHSQAELEALMWDKSGRPVPWNADWAPVHPNQLPDEPVWEELLALLAQHPQLMIYTQELAQLDVERRWKQEQFKPQLTFNYNFLADRLNFMPGDDTGIRALVSDNYKWGFTFTQPILMRKARAGLGMTDIKIAQTNWKFSQKQQELTTKLQAYWQEWNLRRQQQATATDIAANYALLMDAEQVKFDLGESSVFLLNTRQQKLLEARLKLLKAQAELQKTRVALWYVAGVVDGR